MTNTPTTLVELPRISPECTLERQAVFRWHADELERVNTLYFTKQAISPIEYACRREKALIGAVQALAECYGALLKPIHGIDCLGEMSIRAEIPGPAMCEQEVGQYGETFAAVLSCVPTRTAVREGQRAVLAESGWCRINHFAAEVLVRSFALQLVKDEYSLGAQSK